MKKHNLYGTGTTSYSPIIALGESWGFHMGHFLSDQQYGVNGSCTSEQPDANGFGITFCPNPPFFTDRPHINVLENYNPDLLSDPFRWIPKGLMWDLMDNGEPVIVTFVNDNVVGYSIQQIYLALQADVNSVPQYRARLIQQNPGNQTNAIIDLFASYNY